MPNRDKTGPAGKGPGTGGGKGDCVPNKGARPKDGRGQGLGKGQGGATKGRRKGPNGITYFT
jgi:hypothetical protein